MQVQKLPTHEIVTAKNLRRPPIRLIGTCADSASLVQKRHKTAAQSDFLHFSKINHNDGRRDELLEIVWSSMKQVCDLWQN
jgi:hypothetical protein